MKYTFFGCVSLRPCYTRQYSLQPTTQHHCAASCRRNKACNTPSPQLATQRKIARQVAEKLEEFSTLRNVAKPVTACNVSTSNLQCFDVVSITLQVAEEIAWCNKALITCTHSYLSPIRPWEGGGGGGKCLLSITFLNIQVVPTKCSDVY